MTDAVRDGPLEVQIREDGRVLWINDELGQCLCRVFVHSGQIKVLDDRVRSPFDVLAEELDGEKAIGAIEALSRAGYVIKRID